MLDQNGQGGEAGEIVCSRSLSIRQNDAVWSRDSDFVAERRIFGKRYSDGGREVKSDEAQGGGETDHFHDLKEWKVKDCGCQKMRVSNK